MAEHLSENGVIHQDRHWSARQRAAWIFPIERGFQEFLAPYPLKCVSELVAGTSGGTGEGNLKMNKPFERDVLIRFHHCDPAGIVFYPQYFVLFNELVEDWFNHGLEVNFALFHIKDRLGIPTVKVECEFLAPSKIGEMLQLRLWVSRIGKSSLTLNIEGRGAGNELRVRTTMVVVLASLDSWRPVPFAGELLEKLQRFVL